MIHEMLKGARILSDDFNNVRQEVKQHCAFQYLSTGKREENNEKLLSSYAPIGICAFINFKPLNFPQIATL